MEAIKTEIKQCISCMETHAVQTVKVHEKNVFKGIEIEYEAIYEYCENTDEIWATEEMISQNDIAMKNAYRIAMGMLTTNQIKAIRDKYGISQSDLAIILSWGEKTITRYESHQVQDMAHNSILVKIDSDPDWFLQLLTANREKLSPEAYKKYMDKATAIFEDAQDEYLRKSIRAQYARISEDSQNTGATELNFDKLVDIVNYFANAQNVTTLYLVKLLKLLWYTDALSYKRTGHSMTGLVYRSMPMGAVPVAYKSLIDLKGIEFEEEDFCNTNTGNHFIPTAHTSYPTLTAEDIDIIQTVINRFGCKSKSTIVNCMHEEDAYKNTNPGDIIRFDPAYALSIQ